MIGNFMSRWGALLVLGVLIISLGTIVAADDAKTASATAEHAKLDQQLADTLRDVHNKGAELYNSGDRNGCYRMFQGALLAIKPLLALHPDLQKEIENGMAAADKLPRVDNQAFELHKLIEGVRGKLKTNATAKPAETTGTIGKGGSKATEATKAEPKKSEAVKAATGKGAAKTLWDRLGGEANVKKIVDDFFALVVADPKVDATRGGKFKIDDAKAADLKAKTVDIISEGSGGPRKYTGKSLKEVHAGMGITDAEFSAAGAHLVTALKKNGVAQADIDEVVKAFSDMRKAIVEQKKPDDKKGEPKKTEDKKAEPKKTEEKTTTPAIQGKVSLNGKPVVTGVVSFYGATDVYTGAINKDGEYFVAKLPPGKYAITVGAEGVAKKYGDRNTSGLICEAVAGSQTFNIDLKQ
jgi:hemoglobin